MFSLQFPVVHKIVCSIIWMRVSHRIKISVCLDERRCKHCSCFGLCDLLAKIWNLFVIHTAIGITNWVPSIVIYPTEKITVDIGNAWKHPRKCCKTWCLVHDTAWYNTFLLCNGTFLCYITEMTRKWLRTCSPVLHASNLVKKCYNEM